MIAGKVVNIKLRTQLASLPTLQAQDPQLDLYLGSVIGSNSHRFLQTDSCEADSELLMNDGCATDGQISEGGSQDELEVLDLSSICFVLFFQVNLLFLYAIV